MLSSRVPPSLEPNAWSRALEERRRAGGARLDLTEANPTRAGLGPDATVLDALADPAALRHDPDPRGAAAARHAISRMYADRGLAVDPADVVLTASTSEAYAHLFRVLCDPGERVLAPRPGYPLFEPLASAEAVTVDAYRLAFDGAWHLDLESLERSTHATTRAVIVVQPNHPTGSCLDASELAALEAWCEHRSLALISDEVFGDFPWDDRVALPSLLGVRRVPTFVLSGLSKVCGLPQMKLGWIACAGPPAALSRALQGLEWVGDLFLSVSTPVQLAAPAWLAGRAAYRTRVRERVAENLAALDRRLEGTELARLPGAGGWVAVLRVPARRTDEEWALAALRRDVVVHPGHFFDFEEEGRLVVSLIVEPATFAEGIERLAATIALG